MENEVEIRVSLKRFTMGDLMRMGRGDEPATIKVIASCLIDPATGDYFSDHAASENYLLEVLSAEQYDEIGKTVFRKIAEARGAILPPA